MRAGEEDDRGLETHAARRAAAAGGGAPRTAAGNGRAPRREVRGASGRDAADGRGDGDDAAGDAGWNGADDGRCAAGDDAGDVAADDGRRSAGDDAGNAAADDGRTTDARTVSRDGDHARDRVIAEFVTDVRAETTDEVVPAAGETEEDAAHGRGGERGARVRGGRRR